MSKELHDFVKQQIEKGLSEEEIKKQLKDEGWKHDDIESAFKRDSKVPKPPAPSGSSISSDLEGVRKLDQKAIWLFFFSAALSFLIPIFYLAVMVGFGLDSVLMGIIVAIVVIFILAYLYAVLSYKFYRYELTDIGFKKEHGIIWKRYVTIPYERIQNVDIHRGVFARILGLSDLQIQTAGASYTGRGGRASEGRLPGVSREDADKLRDTLVRLAQSKRDQGL